MLQVWLRLSVEMVLLLAWVRSSQSIMATELHHHPCPLTLFTHTSLSLTYMNIGPTDDAFAALPEGTVEALLADIPQLTEILLTHCFDGNTVSSMVTSGPITTLSGNIIDAVVTEDGISFDGSNVIDPDVIASNGVAHVIDKVIIPKSAEPAATTTTVAPTEAAMTAPTEEQKDDHSSMDGVKDDTGSMAPSSAAMYGTAVAAAAVSAGFAMLI